MRTTSIYAATALAFAASVSAVAEQADRPRIYYPRQIKREFVNSTVTETSPISTPSTPPTTTTGESSSRRDTFGDIISGIFGGGDTSSGDTKIKTVIVESTVIVPPPPLGTGGTSSPTLLPTTRASTTTTKAPTTKSSTRSSTESSDTDTPIIIAPTGIVSSTKDTSSGTFEKSTVETTPLANSTSTGSEAVTTTSTDGGILKPIETLISSVLNPTPANTTVVPTETSTLVPSGTETSTTETPIIILPTLTSIIGTDSTTTPSSTPSVTEPIGNTTSTDVPTVTSVPTSITSSLPTVSSTTTGDIPIGNSTTGTVTPSATGTATSLPTTIPVTNGTSTDVPTSVPTDSQTVSASVTSTAIHNSTVAVPTSAPSSPVVTSTSIPTTPTAIPSTTVEGVTSIRPTATLTNTDNWLPTSLVAEPTTVSFSTPTETVTGSSSTALPTGIPAIIHPNDGNKVAPAGTREIQIGFLHALNYEFVASNTLAAAQIFAYLPKALADAGGFTVDRVQVSKLVPMDTRKQLNYITTIAKINYPETLLDSLQMQILAPNSKLYLNEDATVRNLTALIDNRIDIYGNFRAPGEDGGPVPTGGAGGGNKNNNDAFDNNNNNSDQSSKQKATTAGIAMGAVACSVMYGAAMFIVARRYKRKRQGHRRASSVANSQDSAEMRYTGAGSPALMGGALLSRDFSNYGGAGGRNSHNSHGSGRSGAGNSGRTANISAPVAAENSLGWN
ncbi:mucin family signaling protein [Purpureocillium lilacinum]|uniref:Mucin family signaling protein n=1 Tax=Purpureocillium lilacinum TaxID=33203 RepID=A0A179HXP8_PURLI|nr:mucin family signaling protein [Purpureocillium lilacinum]KAK4092781.1 hypothetical protein Purlil1_2706 [Purpureocillium lilacinum]OAQ87354.1 mucin family signaling protein [Purpureocillium lilacinum]OAQ95306.1 mucin family signaling protein [Purpureocillium lilacinum]PWI71350.1 hypothetical protein PCL_11444 [Purpureocillium lilacinum]GJN80418.1 hypothetical protein PLIIFM63780_003944 [Purpureocillium lilacinum]